MKTDAGVLMLTTAEPKAQDVADEITLLHAIRGCEQLARELPTAPAGWIVTQVSAESDVDAGQLRTAWTRQLLAATTARASIHRIG